MKNSEKKLRNVLHPLLFMQTLLGSGGFIKSENVNLFTYSCLLFYSVVASIVISIVTIDTLISEVDFPIKMLLLPVWSYRISLCLNYLVVTFKTTYFPNHRCSLKIISNDIFSIYAYLCDHKDIPVKKILIFTTACAVICVLNVCASFYQSHTIYGDEQNFISDSQGFATLCVAESEMIIFSTLIFILADCVNQTAKSLLTQNKPLSLYLNKDSIELLRTLPTTVDKIGNCNDLLNLSRASDRYFYIINLVKRLTAYFKFQIILYLNCVFWFEILSVGFQIVGAFGERKSFDPKLTETLYGISNFTRVLGPFVLLCVSCQRLATQVDRLKDRIAHIAVRSTDVETRCRVRALLRAISLDPGDITIFGMFRLEMRFMLLYAGVITTYMVVVLQFSV